MPDLRKEIEAAIAAHPHNPGQAAIAVCLLLDDMLALSGNGWWDNDPKMLDLIEKEEEQINIQDIADTLRRMKSAMLEGTKNNA